MFVPALTPAEHEAYLGALWGQHQMRVEAHLLDLSGRAVLDLTSHVVDAQVDADSSKVVRRSAQLTVLDPGYGLGFDDRSAEVATAPINRMVRLWHSVRVPALGRWVSIPVFTGPLVRVARQKGGLLKLSALDKTFLYSQPRNNDDSWWPVGTKKTDVIRSCAATVIGDMHVSVPDLPDRTVWSHRLTQHGRIPWTLLWVMASSMGMRLYFDGEGLLRLERWQDSPALTLTDGAGGALLSEPVVESDWSERATTIRVTGGEVSPGRHYVGVASFRADPIG